MAMHTHAGEIFFCANDSVKPSETPKQPDAANCPEIADFAGSDCGSLGRACGKWLRKCPSFPGYVASPDGIIFSQWRRASTRGSFSRSGGSVYRIDPEYLFPLRPFLNGSGYLQIDIRNPRGPNPNRTQNWQRRSIRVHVLVADAFHGPRPHGAHVRHLNGISTDNRADNLAWGTREQNVMDRIFHRSNRGRVRVEGEARKC